MNARDNASFGDACANFSFDGEAAIDWLRTHREMNDIFPEKEIVEHVRSNYEPEYVFGRKDLEAWALENGFVRESSP